MTKIRCLTKLLVFIANLIKLEGCLFFKEDLPWCHSDKSLRKRCQEKSGDRQKLSVMQCAAARSSTEALPVATSVVTGIFLPT